jgi:hypothetical protein
LPRYQPSPHGYGGQAARNDGDLRLCDNYFESQHFEIFGYSVGNSVKKISIMLCVVLLAGHPVPPLAALPMRPIAKWSGALAVLIAAGVIAGSSLKMKRLEKLKRSLSTASLKTLKGNQRWQNQLKLHALENSLESAQFYRSLGIAGLAVGGALAGAGFLWPKDEEGGADQAGQLLVPGGAGVPVDQDFDLALRNSREHQSGRYDTADIVNPPHHRHLPPGAGVGFLSGGGPPRGPVLPAYVPEKMYLVVPPEEQKVVMPVESKEIASHCVQVVTVPGDGHCLLYSFLFFKWLEANPGKGIPKNFALQAKQVSFMRRLICTQMKKKVDEGINSRGESEAMILDGEIDRSGSLSFAFLINRVKEFYSEGVFRKLKSAGDTPLNMSQLTYAQFGDGFDAAVLLKAFFASNTNGPRDLMTHLGLDYFVGPELSILDYVNFFFSPLCRNKPDAIREHLKQQVTVRQLANQYLEIYREHIACPVPVFEGGLVPMPVDSQYYLGDQEAELLALMFKTKIYVYYKNPSAGTYTHQKTYGRSLPPNSPIISLVNINSNHWAPLVVRESVAVGFGAGAAAGSSIE